MNTGNKILDALIKNNQKLDKLQATMEKVEANTKLQVTP